MKKKKSNFVRALARFRMKVFQPFFRKMVGWSDIEGPIESLYYILNNGIDITAFPKATGPLRQTQLADTELLRIFHEICVKNGLKYWLDWGTLLGAVRHKGFIPWDDDLDVSMPQEDYEKACKILPEILPKFGIEVGVAQQDRSAFLVYWKGGMILDIYPVDSVAESDVESHAELKARIEKYHRYLRKTKNKKSVEETERKKREIIGERDLNNPIWYHNPDYLDVYEDTAYNNDTIFPLKTIQFEDYQLFVPNDLDAYLKETYGEYMSFPRSGILHHSGGETNIFYNSVKYGVDMDSLIEHLKTIKFIDD